MCSNSTSNYNDVLVIAVAQSYHLGKSDLINVHFNQHDSKVK